jgi:hypothetical protein
MSPIGRDASLLETSQQCITCVRFVVTTFAKLFNYLSGRYLNELGKGMSNPKPKQKKIRNDSLLFENNDMKNKMLVLQHMQLPVRIPNSTHRPFVKICCRF